MGQTTHWGSPCSGSLLCGHAPSDSIAGGKGGCWAVLPSIPTCSQAGRAPSLQPPPLPPSPPRHVCTLLDAVQLQIPI